MPTVKEAVLGYINERISPDFKPLEDHSLVGDLNLDSLDIVELAMHLEDSLGIVLDDEEGFRKAETLGDLISFVRRKTGLE